MPILLEPRDVTADLENVNSVLIVSCPSVPTDEPGDANQYSVYRTV